MQSHHAFQKAVRTFVDETLYPDAQAVQDKGKKPSQKVFDEIARLNVHAIRLGPGEHLKGRELFNGTVKPEEVCYVDLNEKAILIDLVDGSLPRANHGSRNVPYPRAWLS